ncbi:MAG TPA: peptidylprolyl isomerase [Acidobacteriota bacterium]|jgi:peptidyl-prolyl cis-trans isomerase B (cyclophilin B)
MPVSNTRAPGRQSLINVLRTVSLCLGALAVIDAEQLPAPAAQQIIVETSMGAIVMEVFPEAAPNHVKKFLERIVNGFYVGTTFHRAVPFGIIQGGDPLSRDPKKRAQYGTGGLNELKREVNQMSHLRGTVSAVLIPGKPESAGSQFFICVTDQTQLDGQFTAFGRVVEGMEVVQKISQLPTDKDQSIEQRVEIVKASLRDRPKPEPVPFAAATPEEMAKYRVVVATSLGNIEIALYPDMAPEHVRQFLRFAQLGLYDGTTFHRVVSKFVIQAGSLSSRKEPVAQKYAPLIQNLKAEFNTRPHVRGAVSMARASDPDSGMDSFFIVLEPQPQLDGKYTVFGQVVSGMDVVDAIAAVPVNGETPIQPIEIKMKLVK